MNDKLLAHEEEVFKLAWTTAVLTAGGTVGLALGEATVLRSILVAVGVCFTIALIAFAVSQDQRIRDLAAAGERRERT